MELPSYLWELNESKLSCKYFLIISLQTLYNILISFRKEPSGLEELIFDKPLDHDVKKIMKNIHSVRYFQTTGQKTKS